MKLLDKYTLRGFLAYVGWSFVSFLVLFYIVDIVENMDKFIDRGAALADVILYYLTYMPFVIVLVSPIALLLSANFACGYMSRHREIVAIRSGGISSLRVALPILAFGLIWSLIMMFFAEFVVPTTNTMRENIKNERIDKKGKKVTGKIRDLLYQTEDGRVLSIGLMDPKRNKGRDVLIVSFDRKDNIRELIRAREMVYDGGKWELHDGHIYDFTEDSLGKYERFPEMRISLSETPDELAERRADPDEMGFFELLEFIKRVRRAGSDAYVERTDLIMKVSYPFINFIIVLFGVPLVLRFRRSGMVIGFAQSITIAFAYFAAIRVGQALGYNGTIPPFFAATLGNIVFGVAGFVLLFTHKD
ncbi:LPS export ABC transporter permease LptG [bacterium]|nr:MAG: LPS export ABC transporter permease LptG [bacterium]